MARSCTKPRNGASPVPAQIMTIGVAFEAGGWNGTLGVLMATGTWSPGFRRDR